ncbi:MAG: right-handed parallel beta-helix repeat-containing protein [Chloroflexi bacterium]|nr:right-handed parallel beta-helix repeat-containing protein [Chloroflexota bacterium]
MWETFASSIPGGGPDARWADQVRPSIIYDESTNTIEVKRPGAVVNLTVIADALRNDGLLERTAPYEWELKANLRTYEMVRLELHGQAAGGDVDWLKLKSDPSGIVWVESSNGQVSIRNTRITSWDRQAGAFDTAFQDGSRRAYVVAKNRSSLYKGNRMDVINSEVAYLGFFEETAYGISWKVLHEDDAQNPGILGQGMTGDILGSKFHHNYFGVYVWGVGDMVVRNNELYENFYYGFDAHTATQRTTVEDNYSHHNGGHGIIFAERCTSNVIVRNRVIDNKGHGIMLHEQSDNNTIVNNEVIGNDDGIPLFESSDNLIAGNTVKNNAVGVRLYGRENASSQNLFENNEITGSQTYGVFMYDKATANTFRNNRILGNRDSGVYLKSATDNAFTANDIAANEFGVRLDSPDTKLPSQGNTFQDNIIRDSHRYGVYSRPPEGANAFAGTQLSGNRLGDFSYSGLSRPTEDEPSMIRPAVFVAIILVAIMTVLLPFLRRHTPRQRSA